MLFDNFDNLDLYLRVFNDKSKAIESLFKLEYLNCFILEALVSKKKRIKSRYKSNLKYYCIIVVSYNIFFQCIRKFKLLILCIFNRLYIYLPQIKHLFFKSKTLINIWIF